MREFFSNALHLFVVVMIVVFIVGGVLALTGNFDHWTERYRLKRRRRRLINDKGQKQNRSKTNKSDTPYYSTKTQ